ncbi:unnamed protein product [Medioppia subpectinata]|uniref:peptide-methionine (S)-S-oxide reductase n=1 Tax=Medioppia subpectinata TaxID=1979941 RepID=A0A7R9KEF3_9ACAR|nr:unnamed protein product [Medioppia subpectinata]CAG2101072.1 unnamed protein product [Medioppia subpectinata]
MSLSTPDMPAVLGIRVHSIQSASVPLKILDIFWANHSPTVCHKRQYMSAIFYHNSEQKQLAEESMKEAQKKLTQPIQTKILPLDVFYEAEDYHQKYMLRKHSNLIKSLGLSDKQLIGGHIAARINGYLGHFGTFATFDKEANNWGINCDQKNYILDQMNQWGQKEGVLNEKGRQRLSGDLWTTSLALLAILLDTTWATPSDDTPENPDVHLWTPDRYCVTSRTLVTWLSPSL